jgi:hypothetical protein
MSDSEQTEQTEQIARRRLLKLAGYVPPALLGAMILGSKPAIAAPGQCKSGGLLISAPAGSCCPCLPIADKYDPKKCCKDHCLQCDVYVQSNGYSSKSCKDVNNWCGSVPGGCNCCLKKGKFVCRSPGQPCP